MQNGFFWSGKVSSFLVALNRPDRWGLSVLCEWTNLRCHRRGSREGAQQFCSGYFYSEQFHPPFPIGLTAHQCAGESKSVCCVSDWREQVLFRFFSPTFVFALGFFSPFVLIKEGSGMCPVCTVYYRQTPSCWDTGPAGISSSSPWLHSHSFRFGLTKAGGTKEGRALFSKGQSQGGEAACRDFQLLNQNSKCECFYLSCTSPGLFPQP